MTDEEHREHARADERAGQEDRVLEEPEVDRGDRRRELPHDEEREGEGAHDEAAPDERRLEPVVALPLLERVLERAPGPR